MRLFSTLFAGRESLMSHGTALAAVSDNLANQNTPGFKENRVEFADLLSDGQGGLYSDPNRTTNGVTVQDSVTLHDKQGALNFTERELDFAIQGRGHFVVSNGTDTFYTRAGNFQTDPNGQIVTTSGETLMGFTAESGDQLVALNTKGITAEPAATTTTSFTGNLSTSAPVIAAPNNPASFTELNDTSQFSTTARAIDSLGETHDITYHFFHTDTLQYTVQAYVDGSVVGGEAGTPTLLGQGVLNFGIDGTQGEGTENILALTPAWANGAAAGNIAVDFSNFTGFATQSSVRSIVSDGVVPGEVTGVVLSEDGKLNASLDNGDFVEIGTVAIADFVNLNGLEKKGNNLYRLSGNEGDITVGQAGTGTLGTTKSGALESSTVDIASQFVDVIRYQRGYQAGSQIISKMDEIINTTLNLAS